MTSNAFLKPEIQLTWFYFLLLAGLNYSNLQKHALNSVYVLMNLTVTRRPVRLKHFYHPVIIAAVYAIFNIIYFFAKGKRDDGKRYIYQVMDWGVPKRAILFLFIAMVLTITLHFLVFGIYKLRQFIHQKCKKRTLPLIVDDESDSSEESNRVSVNSPNSKSSTSSQNLNNEDTSSTIFKFSPSETTNARSVVDSSTVTDLTSSESSSIINKTFLDINKQ